MLHCCIVMVFSITVLAVAFIVQHYSYSIAQSARDVNLFLSEKFKAIPYKVLLPQCTGDHQQNNLFFLTESSGHGKLILEPVQYLFAHVFSVNFTAFCVKNSCRATARLRIFALKSAKIHSKIHARQDTKQALS